MLKELPYVVEARVNHDLTYSGDSGKTSNERKVKNKTIMKPRLRDMMLKRWFDWTPRDIAYWEKIRQRGFGKFIVWYGVLISGGMLFIVFGALTFLGWIKQTWSTKVTPYNLYFLVGQLVFVALVCLLGGIINSLITWVVENRQYQKYSKQTGE